VLSLQLPSLRAMYKYLPAPLHKLIPLCFLLAFFVYAVLFRTQKLFEITKVFLNKKSFFILLFILITLVNILVYPLADSLKYQARGSDQDDALIVGAKNLISGKNPYEAHTYFPGNPLSPGPGWLIMNLPFTTSGLYCLLTPFYISVLGLLIRKLSAGYYAANVFLILCSSSLAFWETMVAGSDLFAVGALFTVCLYFVYAGFGKSKLLSFLSAMLLALAATSRIIFAYIIAVMGILLWRRSGKKYIGFLVFSLVFAVLLHLIFYLWNPGSYTPLHLIRKGNRLMPFALKIPCIILSLSFILRTFFKAKTRFDSWLFYFWLCMAIPISCVSFGELIVRGFNLTLWEGANYLIVLMLIYVVYFALGVEKEPNRNVNIL